MKKRGLFLIINYLLFFIILFPFAFSLEGWDKFVKINIKTIDEIAPQNYQVLVNFDDTIINDFNWYLNCNDVRFIDEQGNSLNYWIEECDNSLKNANIWVKINQEINNYGLNITMFYDNPDADSESDGKNTFVLFGDFLNNELDDGWTWDVIKHENEKTDGDIDFEDGKLILKSSHSKDVWNNDYQATLVWQDEKVQDNFEAIVKILDQTSTHDWAKSGIIVQNTNEAKKKDGKANVLITPRYGVAFQWQETGWLGTNYYAPNEKFNNELDINFPIYLKLQKKDNKISTFYSYNQETWFQVGSTKIPAGINNEQYIALLHTTHNSGSQIGRAVFDMFYTKKYVSNEPIVEIITSDCTSNCEDKECGDDGCDGVCGICDDNEFCNEDGQCVECLDNSHCDEENNEICNQENQCIIEEDEINIFFHAIVCDYENLLPKWAHHDVNYHNPKKPNKINSTTAIDFIELKGDFCSFDNLEFQFSKDNENWHNIGESNAEGGLILTLNESKIDEYGINLGELYFRTIENEDYINFSGPNDEDYISAEFYCHEDIELFDNIEKINLEFNKNYYCVAFNTKEPECYIGENKCSSTYGYLNCSLDDYKWVVVEPTVGKDYCENCSEDNIWINGKCCGILENEEIKARFCGSDTSCDTDDSDIACCDSWNSCVFNGQCYPNNHLFYEENMYCKEGVWIGGDGNEEACNEFISYCSTYSDCELPENSGWKVSISRCCGDDGLEDPDCELDNIENLFEQFNMSIPEYSLSETITNDDLVIDEINFEISNSSEILIYRSIEDNSIVRIDIYSLDYNESLINFDDKMLNISKNSHAEIFYLDNKWFIKGENTSIHMFDQYLPQANFNISENILLANDGAIIIDDLGSICMILEDGSRYEFVSGENNFAFFVPYGNHEFEICFKKKSEDIFNLNFNECFYCGEINFLDQIKNLNSKIELETSDLALPIYTDIINSRDLNNKINMLLSNNFSNINLLEIKNLDNLGTTTTTNGFFEIVEKNNTRFLKIISQLNLKKPNYINTYKTENSPLTRINFKNDNLHQNFKDTSLNKRNEVLLYGINSTRLNRFKDDVKFLYNQVKIS